jgi:ribosome maturation factor RimP
MVTTHIAPFETPPEGLDEARLILENGQARRIADIVAAPLRSVGYRLVRVKLSTAATPILQVMAERPDGAMGVEDCEAASMAISPHLDLEDPIHAPYRLEMSSPGIDRPLVRESDFRRALGHEARVELAHALESRKRFRGIIEEVEATDGGLYVHLRPVDDAEPQEIVARLAVADMAEARLVLTEALIRDALRREKTGIKTRKDEVRREKAEGRKAENQRKQEKEARRHAPKA